MSKSYRNENHSPQSYRSLYPHNQLSRMKDLNEQIHNRQYCELDKSQEIDESEQDSSVSDSKESDSENNDEYGCIKQCNTSYSNKEINQYHIKTVTHRKTVTVSQSLEPDKLNINNSNKKKQQKESQTFLYAILGIIFIIIVTCLVNYQNDLNGLRNIESDSIFVDDVKTKLKSIRSLFKKQDDYIWKNIFAGIMQVFEKPEKPSIFLLFANDTQPMECLALMIGDVSRHALKTKRGLVITPAALDEDTGYVIKKLKPRVEESKAVVGINKLALYSRFQRIVFDLLTVNIKALLAFHNLCDRVQPLVKKAIYVITIIVDGYDESRSTTSFVQQLLKQKLLGKAEEDIIMPLITRITDGQIFAINPELVRCPISKDSFTELR